MRFTRAITTLFVGAVLLGQSPIARTATAVTLSDRDLATARPEAVGVSSERLRRLHDGMRRFVDEGRVAGVSTLLARRGKIVDFFAAGRRDVRQPDLIGRDTIFRIYSMTKPVTGVAMLMLFEEGKWRLEDPVSRHLPEFANLKVYAGENPDGSLKVEDLRRPMTMRELLTHSGGLGYLLSQSHPVDRQLSDVRALDAGAPLQAMIDKLVRVPLRSQPGTRWYYSIGVDVQGYLVERLSGQPFDEFLRTRLFEPLGMKDTAFHVGDARLDRLARVHTDGPDGRPAPPSDDRAAAAIVPLGPSGGGGLYSTIDDYLRFAQMLLNGGELNGRRYLAPRTVRMMRTNHLSPEALATIRPGTGWGLNVRVIVDAAAAGEIVSDGTYDWYGIAGTWFWIDPAADLAFVGMIQHRGRANSEIQGISRNLVYQAVVDE